MPGRHTTTSLAGETATVPVQHLAAVALKQGTACWKLTAEGRWASWTWRQELRLRGRNGDPHTPHTKFVLLRLQTVDGTQAPSQAADAFVALPSNYRAGTALKHRAGPPAALSSAREPFAKAIELAIDPGGSLSATGSPGSTASAFSTNGRAEAESPAASIRRPSPSCDIGRLADAS